MKKAVAIFIACCMLISAFTAAVSAQTAPESYYDELYAAVGAVADKLDPSVIDCLYSATDEGKFFEIQYHNDNYPPYTSSGGVNVNNVYYAEEELLAQIGKIGYYECPNGCRGKVNKIQVGLPYTSVVRVAALDNVDYITLPDESNIYRLPEQKIYDDLREKAAQMNPNDSITLNVLFAYEAPRIYVGIDLSKCKTEEERENYYRVKEEHTKAYYTAKNEEYKNRLVQNAARDGITVGNLTYSETTPWILVDTTVSAIDVLAGYEDILTLTLPQEQPPTDVTEVPSECCTEAPSTAPTEAPTEPGNLYRERLKEYYNLDEFDGDWYTYQLMEYKELYYHRDNNGEIDWALIQCYCNIASPVDMAAVVGNRVLHPGTAYYPFDTTFGIYDVKNDKFIDPSWSGKDYLGGKEAYKYDGFVRAFDEIVGGGMGESLADVDYRGKGRPLGDIDNDFDLSIVDVTMIQRCEAMIAEYPATDELWLTYDYNGEHYYSDFNLDGERDIVDATCIQRYLAGMDYPIG